MFEAKVGSWLIDDLSRDERHRMIERSAGAAGMIAALMNAEREAAGKFEHWSALNARLKQRGRAPD